MARYRIRRCNGNRNAWGLYSLREDGTERESFGSYTTAMSIDSLLANAGHLKPLPNEIVELVA
ncbi:MAG: hypothetical protein EOS72_03160 [Mesorhizobium sp.]|uniref:hypothetical protein n=1 Tax=Mesorhizobium sp. TaxID=1871066 RepID=UPI000FE9DB5E|nr:hypothetical protein [Mesorhizobium sp.]RWC91668.1 MAG: hypothetical protein EOS72_03160 [Mesorhizobium sp.]